VYFQASRFLGLSEEMGQSSQKPISPTPLPEYTIVVLGSDGVGKTSLCLHFVKGEFPETVDSSVTDSYRKMVKPHFMLDIIDISDSGNNALVDLFLRSGQGFILVYSVIDQLSFEKMETFRENIFRVKGSKDVPVMLVANKLDLKDQRVVSTEQGEKLAKQFGYPSRFSEISAREKTNVDQLFLDFATELSQTVGPTIRIRKKW